MVYIARHATGTADVPSGVRVPRRVALVGIDGSGKSTQARRLAIDLTALGLPARYLQNAGGRRWLGRLAARLGRPDALALLGVRGVLMVESVLRWFAIARTLLRAAGSGRLAVMDRYAVCQYASIRAHSGQPPVDGRPRPAERLARLAYRLFPEPDVTFLLAVDPAVAYRRIEVRGTDHETPAYLAAATAAYRSLPEYPRFVVIDANRTPDEVAAEIRSWLAPWLPETGPMPVPAPAAPLGDLAAQPAAAESAVAESAAAHSAAAQPAGTGSAAAQPVAARSAVSC